MRKSLMVALSISGALATAALAWPSDDTVEVGNVDIPYRLTSGANVETGVVHYHAYITRHINEAGHASTWNHPVDDRRCEWSMQAHLKREVCFSSIMGGQSCNNGLTKELPISINGNNGQPSNFFDHRPCTDAGGQIANDLQSIKNAVDLPQLADADLHGDLQNAMQGSGATVTFGH